MESISKAIGGYDKAADLPTAWQLSAKFYLKLCFVLNRITAAGDSWIPLISDWTAHASPYRAGRSKYDRRDCVDCPVVGC